MHRRAASQRHGYVPVAVSGHFPSISPHHDTTTTSTTTTLPFPWLLEVFSPRKITRLQEATSPLPLLPRQRHSLCLHRSPRLSCPPNHTLHPYLLQQKGPISRTAGENWLPRFRFLRITHHHSATTGRFAHTPSRNSVPSRLYGRPPAERPSHRHRPRPTD